MECKNLGDIDGNPNDKVSAITFNNITATAETPVLNNKYKDVKLKNVKVNGKAYALK